MPEYDYDQNDGRLHTRFSRLKRCTAGQVDDLIAELHGEVDPFQSSHLQFGTDRHEMWAKESGKTGTLPRCFWELPVAVGVKIDHVEREFATELVRGVVVHSRPDAVSIGEQAIFDYKTVLVGLNGPEKTIQGYRSSKQAIFYAAQLQLHGIAIRRCIYLCELWDTERETILGYRSVIQEITPEKIAEVIAWAKDRIITLQVALNDLKEAKARLAA